MSDWDKTKLARSYNKEAKEYDEAFEEVIEAMATARPVGKGVVIKNGKMYEVDYNFNPPRVTKLEIDEEKEEG